MQRDGPYSDLVNQRVRTQACGLQRNLHKPAWPHAGLQAKERQPFPALASWLSSRPWCRWGGQGGGGPAGRLCCLPLAVPAWRIVGVKTRARSWARVSRMGAGRPGWKPGLRRAGRRSAPPPQVPAPAGPRPLQAPRRPPPRPSSGQGLGGLGASPPNLNVPWPRPHLPAPAQVTLRTAAFRPAPGSHWPRAPFVSRASRCHRPAGPPVALPRPRPAPPRASQSAPAAPLPVAAAARRRGQQRRHRPGAARPGGGGGPRPWACGGRSAAVRAGGGDLALCEARARGLHAMGGARVPAPARPRPPRGRVRGGRPRGMRRRPR